jgi:hypothetical protein
VGVIDDVGVIEDVGVVEGVAGVVDEPVGVIEGVIDALAPNERDGVGVCVGVRLDVGVCVGAAVRLNEIDERV